MSAGRLAYTLAVRHPETGEATALLAGEPVPEWAKGLVHADDFVKDEAPAAKSARRSTEK